MASLDPKSGDFTVGDYLLHRLAEIGIGRLFGVPGDYNLAFLDRVIAHPGIGWVGNANELNAAYAADGYARINGAGALLTTFGVGELSAINGIAGSYAEYVPVLHVTGAPVTAAQKRGALLHHTLGDGDFGRFLRAHAEVTVAQAALTVENATAENATAEIDRVIATMLHHRRPAYLVLPADVAAAKVAMPAGKLPRIAPEHDAASAERFRARALAMLAEAGSVSLLADFLADRFGLRRAVKDLVEASHLPHATLALGKGVLDETAPGFLGTYAGSASPAPLRLAVESADVVLAVGVRFTDTITAGFSQDIPTAKLIDVQPFETRIGEELFERLPMAEAVAILTEILVEIRAGTGRRFGRGLAPALAAVGKDRCQPLTQDDLWATLQTFLKPGDIVIAEQGTAFFGAATLRLPKGVDFIGQPLWGSIGYTLPAAFGAQFAAPERRVILLIGDGSALMTIQELGTMIHYGAKPIVVVFNNDGYTVERAIHGPEQRYNDIPSWNWSLLTAAMGGAEQSLTLRARNQSELRSALDAAAAADRLVLLEAVLPRMDVPELLDSIAQAITRANKAAA